MLYQRKSAEPIDALQLTADNQAEVLAWTNGKPGTEGTVWVTLNRSHYAGISISDYVIKYPNGTMQIKNEQEFTQEYGVEGCEAPEGGDEYGEYEGGTEEGAIEITSIKPTPVSVAADVSKRTLEDKLRLPFVKVDLGCGLNRHEKEENEYIYIDGDPADGIDIVCDWNDIPLENGIVSGIHFSDAIEHIRPWEYNKTFGEINRIMKVGGLFYGTTPNRANVIKCAYEGTMTEEWVRRNLWGDSAGYGHTHYHVFTKPELKELLEKYGFGEVEFATLEDWISFSCKKLTDL